MSEQKVHQILEDVFVSRKLKKKAICGAIGELKEEFDYKKLPTCKSCLKVILSRELYALKYTAKRIAKIRKSMFGKAWISFDELE